MRIFFSLGSFCILYVGFFPPLCYLYSEFFKELFQNPKPFDNKNLSSLKGLKIQGFIVCTRMIVEIMASN